MIYSVLKQAYDINMVYDNCGNITSKTGVSSSINYGEGTGPHALTSIDNPDTAYYPPPQAISYNHFNKVSSISDTLSGGVPLTLDITYGLSYQRIKTVQTRNSTIERVKYFDVDYEEDSTSSGLKKYHYIYGGTGLTAIFVMEGSGNDTMHYVLSDHLGSLTGIVNATTSAVTKYSFNAWGIPRDASDWTKSDTSYLFAGRGYTGHEHLTDFSLINMNGRVYDPILGRFLSPDPFVQAPSYPNAYNRYSYVLNNPLKYVDPSGYQTLTTWYIASVLMNMPDGSSWDRANGFSNSNHNNFGGGGGGSLQAAYGGGSFSVSLGGSTNTYYPSKQRYGRLWDKINIQIHLPEIVGYEWISDPVVMESGFPEMADISWIHQPIDDIYPGYSDQEVSKSTAVMRTVETGYKATNLTITGTAYAMRYYRFKTNIHFKVGTLPSFWKHYAPLKNTSLAMNASFIPYTFATLNLANDIKGYQSGHIGDAELGFNTLTNYYGAYLTASSGAAGFGLGFVYGAWLWGNKQIYKNFLKPTFEGVYLHMYNLTHPF